MVTKKKTRAGGKVEHVTKPPRTASEFFALPKNLQDEWERITHVVSKVRATKGSLSRIAQEFNLNPRLVSRVAKSAFRKRANGQYVAKASDRLLRVINVNTPAGLREVATRDSRETSIAGKHSAAVLRHLQTGDDKALRKIRRRYITDANGKRVKLLTDIHEIDRQGNAGVLSFTTMYARTK